MQIYGTIDQATTAAQRRADRTGKVAVVIYRDDLCEAEGGYLVEGLDGVASCAGSANRVFVRGLISRPGGAR